MARAAGDLDVCELHFFAQESGEYPFQFALLMGAWLAVCVRVHASGWAVPQCSRAHACAARLCTGAGVYVGALQLRSRRSGTADRVIVNPSFLPYVPVLASAVAHRC